MTRLTYRVRFDSDWHIGTGVGDASVLDRLVARDPNGFPYVPAKSITGVVRDAAETIALGLDNGASGPWSDYVCRLFGDQPAVGDRNGRAPRPASVSIRSAHVTAEFAASIPPAARGDMCTVRASTAIDRDTGTAARGTLRQIEVARAGTALVGEITIDRDADVAFLTAALAAVRAIGGSRRRGLGRCVIELFDESQRIDPRSALDALACLERPPEESPPDDQRTRAVQAAPDEATGWVEIDLVLDLLESVVVRSGVRGNVIETAERIGGTQLLPVITEAGTRAGVDVRGLVAAGSLVMTPATPMIGGQRSSPMPFCFSQDKEADREGRRAVVNTLYPEPVRDDGEVVQRKQLRNGWVAARPAASDGTVPLLRAAVAVSAHTHAVIDDSTQRPDESTGGLFTYETIEAGQRFGCRLAIRAAESVADSLIEAINGDTVANDGTFGYHTSIGTSRKDQYGRVRLTAQLAAIDAARDSNDPVSSATLLFDSELIVLGDRLRPTPTVDAVRLALAERLGRDESSITVNPEQVRLRTTRIDGWHGRWNLPRASLAAVAAGSVIRFEFEPAIDRGSLTEIERGGLGERCAEGFGAVRFDPAVVAPLVTLNARESDRVEHELMRPAVALEEQHDELRNVVLRQWIRSTLLTQVDTELERLATHLGLRSGPRPSRTQWNQLREQLSAAQSSTETVSEWLKGRSSETQWSKAAEQMTKWIGDPKTLLDNIGLNGVDVDRREHSDFVLVVLRDICEKLSRNREQRS